MASHPFDKKEIERRLADYYEAVVKNIAEYGVHLNSVFPTKEQPGHWFTYTTGCFMIDKPELIVFGLPPEVAGTLCNEYYKRIKGGEEFADWDRSEHFLRGYDVVFRRVVPSEAREYLTVSHSLCRDVTGHDPECLVMAWPDKEGRFPWEPGFSEKLAGDQTPVWDVRN